MCRASSNPDNDLDRTTGGERGDMPSYAASAMRCRNLIIVTTIKAVLREDERAETMSVPVHKESKPKGGLNYGIIDWYDPPMCERVVQIIPGLLNSTNNLHDQAEKNLHAGKNLQAENHLQPENQFESENHLKASWQYEKHLYFFDLYSFFGYAQLDHTFTFPGQFLAFAIVSTSLNALFFLFFLGLPSCGVSLGGVCILGRFDLGHISGLSSGFTLNLYISYHVVSQ
nr:zinc finger, GRF-type [Tanacetum cinerariifolium]